MVTPLIEIRISEAWKEVRFVWGHIKFRILQKFMRLTWPIGNWKYHTGAQITVGGYIWETIWETLGVKICCKGINSPRRQHCPPASTPGQLLLSLVLLVFTRQSDSHPWLLPAPERPGQWWHLEPPPSQAAWALPLLNAAAALPLPPIATPTVRPPSLIASLKLQAFPCLMYCQHLNIFL